MPTPLKLAVLLATLLSAGASALPARPHPVSQVGSATVSRPLHLYSAGTLNSYRITEGGEGWRVRMGTHHLDVQPPPTAQLERPRVRAARTCLEISSDHGVSNVCVVAHSSVTSAPLRLP